MTSNLALTSTTQSYGHVYVSRDIHLHTRQTRVYFCLLVRYPYVAARSRPRRVLLGDRRHGMFKRPRGSNIGLMRNRACHKHLTNLRAQERLLTNSGALRMAGCVAREDQHRCTMVVHACCGVVASVTSATRGGTVGSMVRGWDTDADHHAERAPDRLRQSCRRNSSLDADRIPRQLLTRKSAQSVSWRRQVRRDPMYLGVNSGWRHLQVPRAACVSMPNIYR